MSMYNKWKNTNISIIHKKESTRQRMHDKPTDFDKFRKAAQKLQNCAGTDALN